MAMIPRTSRFLSQSIVQRKLGLGRATSFSLAMRSCLRLWHELCEVAADVLASHGWRGEERACSRCAASHSGGSHSLTALLPRSHEPECTPEAQSHGQSLCPVLIWRGPGSAPPCDQLCRFWMPFVKPAGQGLQPLVLAVRAPVCRVYKSLSSTLFSYSSEGSGGELFFQEIRKTIEEYKGK